VSLPRAPYRRLLNDDTKVRSINVDRATLYLRDTKNSEPVTVHLLPVLVEKFRAMPARAKREGGRAQSGADVPFLKRDPEPALVSLPSRRPSAQAVGAGDEARRLSFPRRECGFHLFCHTYGTWMLRYGGLDNYGLARTGRWKDPRSPEVYLHTEVSSEAKQANLMPTPKRAKDVQTKIKRK
jgi:hypothetical protein